MTPQAKLPRLLLNFYREVTFLQCISTYMISSDAVLVCTIQNKFELCVTYSGQKNALFSVKGIAASVVLRQQNNFCREAGMLSSVSLNADLATIPSIEKNQAFFLQSLWTMCASNMLQIGVCQVVHPSVGNKTKCIKKCHLCMNFSTIRPANELETPFIPGSLIDTISGIMCSPASMPDDRTVNMKDFKSHSYAKSNMTTHHQNQPFFLFVTQHEALIIRQGYNQVLYSQLLLFELESTCARAMLPPLPVGQSNSHNLSGAAPHNSAPVNINTKSTMMLSKHSC